jgi:hypothetical protein
VDIDEVDRRLPAVPIAMHNGFVEQRLRCGRLLSGTDKRIDQAGTSAARNGFCCTQPPSRLTRIAVEYVRGGVVLLLDRALQLRVDGWPWIVVVVRLPTSATR